MKALEMLAPFPHKQPESLELSLIEASPRRTLNLSFQVLTLKIKSYYFVELVPNKHLQSGEYVPLRPTTGKVFPNDILLNLVYAIHLHLEAAFLLKLVPDDKRMISYLSTVLTKHCPLDVYCVQVS